MRFADSRHKAAGATLTASATLSGQVLERHGERPAEAILWGRFSRTTRMRAGRPRTGANLKKG